MQRPGPRRPGRRRSRAGAEDRAACRFQFRRPVCRTAVPGRLHRPALSERADHGAGALPAAGGRRQPPHQQKPRLVLGRPRLRSTRRHRGRHSTLPRGRDDLSRDLLWPGGAGAHRCHPCPASQRDSSGTGRSGGTGSRSPVGRDQGAGRPGPGRHSAPVHRPRRGNLFLAPTHQAGDAAAGGVGLSRDRRATGQDGQLWRHLHGRLHPSADRPARLCRSRRHAGSAAGAGADKAGDGVRRLRHLDRQCARADAAGQCQRQDRRQGQQPALAARSAAERHPIQHAAGHDRVARLSGPLWRQLGAGDHRL